MTDATTRVAYLVSKYPAISHTFIEREVLGVRRHGIDVQTFSVRRCPESELKSAVMRDEAATTTVLITGDKQRDGAAYAKAHAMLLRRNPTAWLKVLRQAMGSGEATPKGRLWQGFYFMESVLLYSHLVERGIRHIHVHFPNVSADVARLTVALGEAIDGPDAGWRWTMTIHGPTEFEAVEKVDLAAKIESAHMISAITDFARSQLWRQVDVDHWDKVRIVPMSVDPAAYFPPPQGRHHDGPLRVLFVGRLVPEKGPSVLLRAVEQLVERGVDVEATFVGGGDLRDALSAQAADAGIADRVTFTGPLGQEELPDLYRRADVFCLPSFQEGLPVVIMEAMATQLPVVVTRIAGIPELVHDGVSGRVVSAGRADALADAIADLAADPAGREAMGQAARVAVLQGHDVERAATLMADFLRDAQR